MTDANCAPLRRANSTHFQRRLELKASLCLPSLGAKSKGLLQLVGTFLSGHLLLCILLSVEVSRVVFILVLIYTSDAYTAN